MNISLASNRVRRGGRLQSLFAGMFLAVAALAGCSQSPGNSAHVVVVTPYNPQAAAGAIVSQTIPRNTGVEKIKVVVTDSTTGHQLAAISALPGVTLALDVESGSNRLISVSALDASGDVLFDGSATRSLLPDANVTLSVNLYGRLLKGPSNLTAGTVVTVLDDVGTSTTGTIDASGAFRIALNQKMVRPYLLLAQDGTGNVVSAAITDAAGPTSLNPVTHFQAGDLLRPTNPDLLTDWQSAWSGWTKTGSAQTTKINAVDTGMAQALALSTIGETQFQIARSPNATTWAMGSYNGLTAVWVAGTPELQTGSGSVAAKIVAGAVVGGNAVLVAPYSGSGLSAANKTAAAGDWLLWKSGATTAPLAITLPTTLSGKTEAEIGAAMRAVADQIELSGYDPSTATGTTAQALASFLTPPLEAVVLNGVQSTLGSAVLSSLGSAMAAVGFDPTTGNLNPIFTATPSLVQSTAIVGTQLTLTGLGATDPNGDPVTKGYQWESSSDNTTWSAIAGKTNASLILAKAQAHRYVRAAITLSDGNGGTASAVTGSIQVGNTAPVFSSAPTFTGTVAVGGVLTAQVATTDADGDARVYSYQWKAAGVAIPGATASTYTVAVDNAHSTILLDVTANDGFGGSVTALSADAPVLNSAPVLGGTAIVGTAKVGAVVSALTTVGDPDTDNVTLTYQWTANGLAIPGATAANFTITATQAHTALGVTVTGTDTFSASTPSTATAVTVGNTVPAFTGSPAFVEGSVVVGGTLTVGGTATSDADGDPVTVTYQWKGSDDGGTTYTPIAGATTSTFTVPQPNAHQTLAVDVTALDNKGGSVTATTATLSVANSAPVLTGLSTTTPINTGYNGLLSVSDPDGDTLIFTVKTAPTKGTLGTIPAGGSFTYTPNVAVFGTDFFTVQVGDGFGGTSTTARVDIAILPFGVTKVWVGGDAAGASNWSNANNWSPVGIPLGSEGVMIPVAATNQPTLSASVACAALYIESGATLSLGSFNLSDSGALSLAGATVTGTGAVILTGSGDIKATALPNLDLQTNGTYNLASSLNITGTLTSGSSFVPTLSSAALTLAATSVDVSGLTLNNTALTLGNGALTTFDYVTFAGFAPTATQLTLNRTSAASVFNGLTFANFPTTGSYILANDGDGAGTPCLVTIAGGAMPQNGASKVTTSGGFQVVWGLGTEDSDSDTYSDAHELAAGSDPLLLTSFPTGTAVTAPIAAPTTWNLAGGPYLVTGAISISGAGSLSVDPGVVVKFGAGASLVAASGATLNLNGTATAPVVLTSVNDTTINATTAGSGTPVAGDWSGVTLAGLGSLSNAEIRYAANGLTITNASPSVTSIKVSDSSGYGIQVASTGTPTAPTLSQIDISNAGAQGLWLNAQSGGTLVGTTVTGVTITNAGAQGIAIDTTGTALGSINSVSITNFTVTGSGAEGVKIASAGGADTITPSLSNGSIVMAGGSTVPALLVTGTAPHPTVTSVVCTGGSAGLQVDTAAVGIYLHNLLRQASLTGVLLNTTGAPTLSTNTIVLNGSIGTGTSGGGIKIAASGPGTSIKHNLIRNNMADLGGGIYVANGGTWTGVGVGGHDLSIDDNLIVENGATGYGGGVFLAAGNPQLSHNTISSNLSGIAAGGGGLYIGGGVVAHMLEDIVALNTDSQVGTQVGDDILIETLFGVGTASLLNGSLESDGSLAASGGLSGNPLFTANWYLGNTATGQGSNSPAVNAGQAMSAINYPYFAELVHFTTRIDGVDDTSLPDVTDFGYHHQAAAPTVGAATSTVVALDPAPAPSGSTTIVISPRDNIGNLLGAGLQVVASVTGSASLTPPLGTNFGVGATSMQAADLGDGTYAITLLTSATTGSSDTVSVSVNGVALSATATVSW
ncbi:MAG: hypothetical protein AUJ55_11730 [Proteobacteria bacterium CG1_02_64_396]|nr:MAG: hypothetical protein AUJ55_11730 [Proteobacteria bacterium CG1_02_64_396]